MKTNILRQVKDIQYQADKILNGKPSITDVKNFGKYSQEIKKSLIETVDIPMVIELINDIPEFDIPDFDVRTGFLALILPKFFGPWYYENSVVEEAKSDVRIALGKYASIEFILKNNF